MRKNSKTDKQTSAEEPGKDDMEVQAFLRRLSSDDALGAFDLRALTDRGALSGMVIA